MTQRRIVLFSPGWPPARIPNGIVTYVGSVRPALKELGYDSRVLTPNLAENTGDPEVFSMDATAPKLSIATRLQARVKEAMRRGSSWSSSAGWQVTGALQNIQKNFPFDLLELEETWGFCEHVQNAFPRIPTIVRLHGPWFLNGPAVGATEDSEFRERVAAEGRAIRAAKAVTAPSQDVLDRTRKYYDVPLEGAEVIPYPGPVVAESERWSLAGCQRNVILFVGRFDRHKGGDLVIDAFAEVSRTRPELELWFVGPDRGFVDDNGREFDMPTYLTEHLPDPAVRARVKVLGQKKHAEIGPLRKQACVTIIASRYETFCIAALEALAFGCPLVASDAGGIPEMMHPGKTALTFSAGNYKQLADRLQQLLDNPALCEELSNAALADYAERLTPTVVAKQMVRFYERTMTAYNR